MSDSELIFSTEYFPTLVHSNTAYFDSAASTQTHQWVLNAMAEYYEQYRSNTHRGSYAIANRATDAVERSREVIAGFIGAQPHQVAFNTGATQGLNTVAHWCRKYPVAFVTNKEHNANVVPWLAQGRSVANNSLIELDVSSDHSEVMCAAAKLFEQHAGQAVLSITAVSNVCGSYIDYNALANLAAEYGIPVCVDACQLVGTYPLDLSANPNITWAVFSGHKMYGPVGVGVLFSRPGFDSFDPPAWGGGNIQHVDIHSGFVGATGPGRMESGTQNVAGIVGIATAAELINYVTYEYISTQAQTLADYLLIAGKFDSIPDMELLNSTTYNNKIFTFRSTRYHPSDVSDILASRNIAVRSGKLCAHSYVNRVSNTGVLRVSVAPYNTLSDCDRLIAGIRAAVEILS